MGPGEEVTAMQEDGREQGREGADELPIDGELDLHPFPPSQVKDLVRDWLEECRARRILHVRIVHGKGIGTLRTTVHAVLESLPWVRRYRLAGDGGGWGATVAELEPPGED
jgi:DNA-nicking Smr family endonuclease